MWPTLRDAWNNFWKNKTYFQGLWDKWVAKVRGLIMAAGAAATVYSEQLAASAPQWSGKIKLSGVILMALSLMLRAGDKTPQAVKDLVTENKP